MRIIKFFITVIIAFVAIEVFANNNESETEEIVKILLIGDRNCIEIIRKAYFATVPVL